MAKENLNLTSPRVVRDLLSRYGLEPQKRWGQNFLIDGNTARKITAALKVEKGDNIIEVGPGAGALTQILSNEDARLLVIEIDGTLVQILEDTLSERSNIKIIHGDVLKLSFLDLSSQEFAGVNRVKLISNLPYVISGPFMYDLFNEGFPFACAVLMFQKEVALRLVAGPGEKHYSALSVLCRYYCQPEILFDVPASVFWPPPKVGSAVIRLKPKEPLLEKPLEDYFRPLVKGLFAQRRKTILNNLMNYLKTERALSLKILHQAGIEHSARPESLKVEQFAKIAAVAYNYKRP